MTNQPTIASLAAGVVIRTLREKGYEAFLVGGCVRDILLKKSPKDFDVTTNATPEQVQQIFEKTLPIGASFGVIVVMIDNISIEVATFRSDGKYSDSRRPDTVSYSTNARDDVQRRDFTINGLLMLPENLSLADGIVDYVGGVDDIKNKIIRCIGDPNARFQEDALRMLRAVRFAAQLGFEVEIETCKAIMANAPNIALVSRERIAMEMFKLVSAPYASSGLTIALFTSLLRYMIPEMVEAKFIYLLERFMRFPTNDPLLGMIMFLADAGYDMGYSVTDAICTNLKLSNGECSQIIRARECLLSLKYMVALRVNKPTAEVKRLARKPGIKYALILLEQDNVIGKTDYPMDCIQNLTSVFRDLTENDIRPTPLINGDDLIAMGLPPGPLFKNFLEAVETKQLNGELSSSEEALEYLKSGVLSNEMAK